MSALSHRTWEYWINTSFFKGQQVFNGYFECTLFATLMTHQTVEFIAEKFEIRNRSFSPVALPPPEIVHQITRTEEGNLCIRLYEPLDTSQSIEETVKGINRFIESISLAVDSPLTCMQIRFVCHQSGKLFVANRTSIGRGLSFEVEERGIAGNKLQRDVAYYDQNSDENFQAGYRHYLVGMQLLGLEDQVSGLLDAAFMQFYQGCEALCRDTRGRLENSKKYIASHASSDSRELQIVAHQVWRVRNKYFGHGDAKYNEYANQTATNAAAVARQVLVARYLCRRLLDFAVPSGVPLVREMGLFFHTYSGKFNGKITEIEGGFQVPFDQRICSVYDGSGSKIEDYTIMGNSL